MAEVITSGDTVLLQTSHGFVSWCADLQIFDFVDSPSDATLCKILDEKGSQDTIVRTQNTEVYFMMLIEEEWRELSKGSNLSGCGSRLTINGNELKNYRLFEIGGSNSGTNATYNLWYYIHTKPTFTQNEFYGYCASASCDGGVGILDTSKTRNTLAIKLIHVDADGSFPVPTEPQCTPNCGPTMYIVNSEGQLLTAESECNLMWKAANGSKSQKWYGVEEVRFLDSFRAYYNQEYHTALAKLPSDSDGLVMDHVCSNYFATTDFREWRYDSSVLTGYKVLFLSYSQLETAEFFLGRGEGANRDAAVAVQGLENAIHLTISESPYYDPNQDCGASGDPCIWTSECCAGECSTKGRCELLTDDELSAFPLWGWLLIILGGLLFMYVIYKLARFVGKADTSKLFKDPTGEEPSGKELPSKV